MDGLSFPLGLLGGESEPFVGENTEAVVLVLGFASPVSGSSSSIAAGFARRFILEWKLLVEPGAMWSRMGNPIWFEK